MKWLQKLILLSVLLVLAQVTLSHDLCIRDAWSAEQLNKARTLAVRTANECQKAEKDLAEGEINVCRTVYWSSLIYDSPVAIEIDGYIRWSPSRDMQRGIEVETKENCDIK